MNAVSLRSVQSWFAGVASAPFSVTADATLERLIRPGPQLSAGERMEIYRSGYRTRLIECLADDYPVLQHALGEDAFRELCSAYIDQHPSRAPTLNYFGRELAAFCAARSEPLSVFSFDLARLEWALVEVLHAPLAPTLDLSAFAEADSDFWSRARLIASPALRLLECDYPVNAYYQAVREGQDPSLPEPRASAVAVYRRQAVLWRAGLTPAMYALASALLAGVPLALAIERCGDFPEIGEPEIYGWFARWIGEGWFGGIACDG